jgi:hypothetical protein
MRFSRSRIEKYGKKETPKEFKEIHPQRESPDSPRDLRFKRTKEID